MLKFKDMYPDSQPYDCFENKNGKKVVRCTGSVECMVCRELSYFTDYILRVCICSEECQDELWKDKDETGNPK